MEYNLARAVYLRDLMEGPDLMEYHSHVTLGEKYEDVATGRLGTATAIQFRHSELPYVKLEWRDADQLRDDWFAAGRLRRYDDVTNGDSI